MNYSLFLSVVFLVCLFGSSHAAGMINVTFTPEDPTSTQVVLADIALGDSLEGTIILTPAPTKPLRFTIVSTVPQIISASHARVTFKTGQTEGKFTLASDSSTGQIGFVTVVISPEIPGTYVPTSFDVLVRGYSSASFAANTGCIASGIAAEIQVTLNPIAPEAVTFVAQTSNGIVSPTTYTVPIGQNEATFSVTGVAIGASVVTFTSNLYLPVTVNFNTYGQIKTTKSSTLIAGAPSTVTVSTVPTNTLSVAVTTTSSNLDVTPSSFTLAAAGTTSVEVIASSSGVATLSFSASSYCTHTDVFTVNASPICSTGYSAIIDGSECAICPGNSEVTDVYSNTCYGNGECTYSSCSSTSTRCVCDSPYVGFACQYNNDTDVFYVFTIDNVAFNVTVEGLTGAQSVLFSVPDNAIAERNIGGDIIFAPYSASNAVFVDPSSNPPSSTSSTEIGWRFEVTCSDNTVDDSTTSPIGVVIDVDSDTYSQYQLALTNLYYFDETTQSWVDAAEYCDSDVYSVDMTEFTITTQICVPGQYNIFVSPPPPLPANTGNPFNPFPTAVSGDRSTTGVTGNNPIAPPLPVFTVTEGDPSPAQKLVDNNLYGSSSILSYSTLLLAILLIFLF